MLVPQALRNLRGYTELTQPDFARKVGMSEASIAHFETGSRKPDPVSLVKFARLAFEIDRVALADIFVKELPGVREGLLIPIWDERARVLHAPNSLSLTPLPASQKIKLQPVKKLTVKRS